MGFDVQNFGIGLLTGWATAYGVYRVRARISAAVDSTRDRAARAQQDATRSADSRYITDLINVCQTSHLAGQVVPLSQILVEPRFMAAPPLAAPPSDDVIHSVFHIIPTIPDHPYLHAPYNIETFTLPDLAHGHNLIALLGLPGSGRTTALQAIALYSLGRIQTEREYDAVQAHINAEEAALTDKERANRAKERSMIEERAREQLREQRGIDFDAEEEIDTLPLTHYMPVYLHLANIDPNATELGAAIDPAEPLVRAVQSQVGRVTASTIPANLYRRLSRGQVLLLLDGFDELPETARASRLAWLQAFLDEYGENLVILAGPAEGYGPLLDLNFAPVFLRPWSDTDYARLADNWAEKWPTIGGTRRHRAEAPHQRLVEQAKLDNRALSPLDVTLKVWSAYREENGTHESWLRAGIARFLPADLAFDDALPQLTNLAVVQIEDGFITLPRLEADIRQMESGVTADPDAAPADDDALLDALMSEAAAPANDAKAQAKAEKDREKRIHDAITAQRKLLNRLQKSGLLRYFRGERYQFRHSRIAAYLASLALADVSAEQMATYALQPEWEAALAYAGMHTNLDAAVRARLTAQPDSLHTLTLNTARWLTYAGSDVNWSKTLLKHIGNLFIAPAQYPALRERAAAALTGTRDSRALVVFQQAVRGENADVRRLACLAMGAIGDPRSSKALAAAISDTDADVQLAAGLGLGLLGTEDALGAMVDIMMEGSEQLRQAVAEAFAAIPTDGHPILYEAISHEDMMVRRAATFGLRRISASWSMLALYRAFLEDSEWYVKSAAQQAFFDMQRSAQIVAFTYPKPEEIPWLVEWAQQHDYFVKDDPEDQEEAPHMPTGAAAVDVLLAALTQGDPEIRQLAARTLGQLGMVTTLPTLYELLADRQEPIREAAHRSVTDLALQTGMALPA